MTIHAMTIRVLLLAVLLLAAARPAGAEGWFALRPEAAAGWQQQAVAPDRVVLRREGQAPDGRRIVVLYARASSAYRTAMSRILDLLVQKRLSPTIEVVLIGEDVAAGRAALRHAEATQAGLVLAMGSETADFLARHYASGRVPGLTVCAKDPVMLGQVRDYDSGSGTNVAFTSLNLPVDTLLAYLIRLRPGLKSVGILVDTDNVSAMQTQAVPLAAALRERGIAAVTVGVEHTTGGPVADQLRARIPPAVAQMRHADPALGASLLLITGSSAVFAEIDAINAAAGTLPVVSMVPDVVGPGESSAVASIGVSFDGNAHLAALYAVDILYGGVRPGSLKVGVVTPPDIALNFRKARQIGLRVPFPLFEMAARIHDGEGRLVRRDGLDLGEAAP